jgi:hypothetical protein
MRVGVDFDNTIVCYDRVFHDVAVRQGRPRNCRCSEHGRNGRGTPHAASLTLSRHSANHATTPISMMPVATNIVSTKKPPRKWKCRI